MKRILTAIAAAIGIAAGVHARTYDLDDGQGWYDFVFTSACHLKNGDEVTGTWGEVRGSFKIDVPITIEDGATVTFRDLKANPDGTFKASECMPAVECLGNATIILKGGNVARSFHDDAPAVFYPPNKTLTIKGPGALVAASVVSWNSGAPGEVSRQTPPNMV